jgi:hypothetical protein
MALRSTQPLTEMSTRNLPGGKKRRRVGLIALPPSMNRMSENVGASTSRNPKGLHGLYRDSFFYEMLVRFRINCPSNWIIRFITDEISFLIELCEEYKFVCKYA